MLVKNSSSAFFIMNDAFIVHAIQPAGSAHSSVLMTCGIAMPRSLMNLLFDCGETPGFLPSVVEPETGLSGPHARGHLAEEARRFRGWAVAFI